MPTTFVDLRTGDETDVVIETDWDKIGPLVARAERSKRGVATALYGSVVVRIVARRPATGKEQPE